MSSNATFLGAVGSWGEALPPWEDAEADMAAKVKFFFFGRVGGEVYGYFREDIEFDGDRRSR